MSDSFVMSFRNAVNEDVLPTYIELGQRLREKEDEVLRANIMYAPSIRYGENEDFSVADRYWLETLFKYHCVFWEDKSTVGWVYGVDESILDNGCVTINFQNYTDRDYELSEWYGIDYFEECIRKVKEHSQSKESLLDYAENALGERLEFDSCTELDYMTKTIVYDYIYKSLDLHKWLYNRSGKFQSFTISAIQSYDELNLLNRKLRSIIKKYKLKEEI